MKYVVMYDRENIRLYDEENGFEPVFIGGECIHPYELTRAKNSIGSIIEELAKEYNLEPSEDEEGKEYYPEISFRTLKCSDKEIDKLIHSVFMAYSCSYIELNKIIDVLYEDIVDSGKDKLALENGINFNGINIKIDRKGIIEEIYSKLNDKKNIIISGEGGCGKTAILKELYTSYLNNTPVCIFKASELNVDNINRIFNFGIDFTSTQFSNCFKDEEKKYFIIDSAEKLAELQNTDVLKNLLNFLRKEGWTFLFTVRHSYISDLEFQLKENFNLSYEIKDIENLSIEELKNTLNEKSINLPENDNLIELIRNLFYLKYYIKYYKSMNSVSDLIVFMKYFVKIRFKMH